MVEIENAAADVSDQKIPTSITIFPPDNANVAITGEEDHVCIDNLTGSQLIVQAETHFEDTESSDEEDPCRTLFCLKN